ncbi:MAG: hypothetical protein WBF25_00090, partial [Terriglobales bacterium]
ASHSARGFRTASKPLPLALFAELPLPADIFVCTILHKFDATSFMQQVLMPTRFNAELYAASARRFISRRGRIDELWPTPGIS